MLIYLGLLLVQLPFQFKKLMMSGVFEGVAGKESYR